MEIYSMLQDGPAPFSKNINKTRVFNSVLPGEDAILAGRQFYIDGVPPGTTIYELARRYGENSETFISDFKEINELTDNNLSLNTRYMIPGVPQLKSQNDESINDYQSYIDACSQGNPYFHNVQIGDTEGSIEHYYHAEIPCEKSFGYCKYDVGELVNIPCPAEP